MLDLSKPVSSAFQRMLALAADVLAVFVAICVSIAVRETGFGDLPESPGFYVVCVVAMCGTAMMSFGLRARFETNGLDDGLHVGTRALCACVAAALMALGFSLFKLPGTPSLYAVFAMSFFVAATVFNATLNGVLRRPIATSSNAMIESKGFCEDARQLLGRDERSYLIDAGKAYADRVVLISGAGGSIGSELARQLLDCGPRKIVLFELNECALYQVHQTMARAAAGTNIEIAPVLGSVADDRRVQKTLHDHEVQVVLHAAAYKHVPLVELNPLAGLQNNVVGTQTLATHCVAAGVERFVLVSSDKAVRPINVMGASKRFCEVIVQDIAGRLTGAKKPIFSIVRFGNVLGSSGSVLPLFRDQVRRGGPVTVTHPDVSRFFMTAHEAVNLVLQAGSMAHGGEIFVLEMGQPIKIEALARKVIHKAGLSVREKDNPEGDIQLKFVGLRRGEKLSEALTFDGKWADTAHPQIFTAIEENLSEFEVASAWRALRLAIANEDEDGARANACRWVQGIAEGTTSSSQLAERQRKVAMDLCVSAPPQKSECMEAGLP